MPSTTDREVEGAKKAPSGCRECRPIDFIVHVVLLAFDSSTYLIVTRFICIYHVVIENHS